MAKDVVIDRAPGGAPRITIDGLMLPWYTAGIIANVPSLDGMTGLTITIPAERVTLLDATQPAGEWTEEQVQAEIDRIRRTH